MQAIPVVGPETVLRDTTHPPTHPLESLDIGRLGESPSRDTPWRDQCQGRNWRTLGVTSSVLPQAQPPSRGWRGAGAGPDPSHSHRAWEGRGQDIQPGTSTNPPEGYELPGCIAGSVQVERGER